LHIATENAIFYAIDNQHQSAINTLVCSIRQIGEFGIVHKVGYRLLQGVELLFVTAFNLVAVDLNITSQFLCLGFEAQENKYEENRPFHCLYEMLIVFNIENLYSVLNFVFNGENLY